MNREVRKKMNAARNKWIEEQCKNIEKEMMSGNNKVAYSTPKALIKTQLHTSVVTEDSCGNVLTESTYVLNRWTECRIDLPNYELHPDTSLLQSNQTPG